MSEPTDERADGSGDRSAALEPADAFFEEVDLHSSYALTRESFERAVEFLRWGRIDADALVTEEIGLAEIPTAFARMERAEGLKKVVRPDE